MIFFEDTEKLELVMSKDIKKFVMLRILRNFFQISNCNEK